MQEADFSNQVRQEWKSCGVFGEQADGLLKNLVRFRNFF